MNYFRNLNFLLLLFLCGCSQHAVNRNIAPVKPAAAIRIATYNVNFGGSNWQIMHPEKTLQAIKDVNADVMVLQEETPYWCTYFKNNLTKLYPYQAFINSPRAGGMGIISKYPFQTTYYGYSKIGWHPGWIYLINTPQGKLQLLNVHLAPPLVNLTSMGFLFNGVFKSRDVRFREMQFYTRQLKTGYPTIIAGDFNESYLTKLRVWLFSQGFQDAKTISHNQQNSWQWQAGLLTFCGPYDRIFYNQYLTLRYFAILQAGDSDHFPAYADLVITSSHHP